MKRFERFYFYKQRCVVFFFFLTSFVLQIYEGDNRYAKVRNLSESTKYRFRIRCSSRVSGAGPWSLPFEFSTEQLPPPTIRSAPIVTEVASGSFQVSSQFSFH